MATTSSPFNWYDHGIKNLSLPTILTDDIRVILVTSAYTPDAATHLYYDADITNEHGTSSGYTIGGLALTTKTLTSSVAGQWIFSSDNPIWSVSGTNLVSRLFVLYNNTPVSNKPLIGYGYLNNNGGSPLDVTTAPGYTQTITVPVGGWFNTGKINGS